MTMIEIGESNTRILLVDKHYLKMQNNSVGGTFSLGMVFSVSFLIKCL
jgi:hypothetical protein